MPYKIVSTGTANGACQCYTKPTGENDSMETGGNHISKQVAMNIISRHDGAQVAMVLCVVLGCSNRSERNKDVSFYRIICVIKKGPSD